MMTDLTWRATSEDIGELKLSPLESHFLESAISTCKRTPSSTSLPFVQRC